MAHRIPAGMSDLVKRYWDTIDWHVTKALRAVGERVEDSALADVDPSTDMYGTGLWGVVYPTTSLRWAVKVTADPTEGPLTRLIMKNRPLHEHMAVCYFLRLWKLADQTQHDGKDFRVWVLLREDITPRNPDLPKSKLRPGDVDAENILVGGGREHRGDFNVRDVAYSLNRALAERDRKNITELQNLLFLNIVQLGHIPQTQLLAEFMVDFWRLGKGALADVHLGNVGFRCHGLDRLHLPRSVVESHQRTRDWVLFDAGHSEIARAHTLGARGIPTIPWRANPATIRDIPTICL